MFILLNGIYYYLLFVYLDLLECKGDIMQYYYDINLSFEDSYVNYYLWESSEHFNRLPVYRVLNSKEFLDNEIELDLEYKNIIISDGVISLGLEIINKNVVYISSLPYEDELKINKMVMNFEDILDIKILKKRENKLVNRIDKIKNITKEKINNGSDDFIKLVYYELTGILSNNVKSMKKFLTEEISSNFSDAYYKIYDMIIIGD